MTFTSTLDRTRKLVSDGATLIAFFAIAVAMLMTVADIMFRNAAIAVALFGDTRPRWGVTGLVDLTQLAVMVAAAFAIAVAFLQGTHIRIDLLVNGLAERSKHALGILAALLGLGLSGICLYTGFKEMQGQLDFTTTSATLGIPFTWYWLPLLAGLALSCLACAIALFRPPTDV